MSVQQQQIRAARLGWFPGLVAFVTLLCFLLLAATGLFGAFVVGRLTGWLLMLHVSAGGAFAVGMALLAVFRSESFAFDVPFAADQVGTGRKILFWLLAACSVVLMITPALMMLPPFGVHGQELLLLSHRWMGVAATLVGLLNCMALAGARRR